MELIDAFDRFSYCTFLPTILFIVFCMYHIYDGMGEKYRVRGLVFSFLTSFFMMHFFHQVLYSSVTWILSKFINLTMDEVLIILNISYFVTGILFAHFVVKAIQYKNKLPGVKKIEPMFGLFIYTQYIIIIFISFIFAKSDVIYNLCYILASVVWYVTFRKNFDVMKYIYPKKKICAVNICLMFEYLVIIMLWFLISFIDINSIGTYFWGWLSALAIIMFVFSLFIHKVIFMETLSEYNEMKSLNHDVLTGLMTRRCFLETGQRELLGAKKRGKQLGVIYVNISHFKHLNQDYGKEAGDTILKEVSLCMKETFEEDAIIARLSDDRFGIVTKEITSIFMKLASIGSEIYKNEKCFKAQIRSGVYLTDEKTKDIQNAIDCAMTACNNQEASGSLSIRFYDEEINKKEKMSLYVLENVDRAIEKGMFKVYYQPIVDVATGKIVSAEALVRWFDDNYDVIPPGNFIPTLEEQNQVYKVDCFVIEQVCKDQKKLKDMGYELYSIGFNISRKDFFVMDMVNYVESMVKKYDITRELVKIEITESAFTNNNKFIAEQIDRFGDMGYKVWMDDFGAGYSSLNILGNFHFDGIKLDLAFLKDMSKAKKELIRGVIQTAKQLGLKVLTEGVESDEQFEILKEVGCDQAQGYRFSKPLPFEEHIKTFNK